MMKAALTILLIGFTTFAFAQNGEKERLEKRKTEIMKEIQELKNLQSQQGQKEKTVLGRISENDAKIRLNEKLISNIQKQTHILNDNIYLNQLKINKLKRELKVLKEDYAAMILKAYKNRSEESRIMFILSSENFLQAYKRIQYMKQYATFRKVQGEEIRNKQEKLEKLNVTLNAQKKDKEQLLAQTEQSKKELEDDKQEQEKLVKSIQKDKKKIVSDLKQRQNEARDIERQIDKIVREAIAAANKKAAAEGAKTEKGTASTSSSKIMLTKEGKIVADNFKANKGRLPWPVEKGYISMGFGKQKSSLASTADVEHHFIEITTEEGANARAIFDGEVSSVQILGGTFTVFIQHGNYLSIYSNLSNVTVTEGQKVSIKQSIGKIRTNPVTGQTVLKLLISQNVTWLDPEDWITPLR